MNCSRRAILRSSSALLFVLALQPQSLMAQLSMESLGASGSIRGAYWEKDKSFSSQRNYGVGSAWLTLRPEEILGSKLYFEGFLQGQNLGRQQDSFGDAREAYVEKSVGDFDFKVGRQIIVWGRADKVNPTDSFTTKDLTFLSSDDEDQRLGQFATQVAYNLGNYRFIGIWQSEWRETRFPVQAPSGVVLQQTRPDGSQNQFGLKLDSSGGEVDWSISYFSGFNRTPDIKIISLGSPTVLGFDYGHTRVVGSDFSTTLGSYGVRGEISYAKTQDTRGDNPLQQNSTINAVLGADRTVVENLNINVQALYRHVEDFVDPGSISDPNSRNLASTLARISNQKYRDQFGVSLRPSYKALNDTLELEVAFVSWQRNGDSLIRPKATYAATDLVKVIVGAEFYDGPRDTFFGQLKDVSSFFAEVRYLF